MVMVVALKRGVLAFWALWLTIVTATNVTDLLQTIGVLGVDWRWVSGNYALVAKALELYALPAGIILLTFGTVIVWDGATAALLWRAAAAYRGREGPGAGSRRRTWRWEWRWRCGAPSRSWRS